jgi:hypothetical protein
MILRFAPALLLLVTGCAEHSKDHFPSLLPRAVEKQDAIDTEVDAPPPAVTSDPTLDAKAADVRKSVAAMHTTFAGAAARADGLVSAAVGKAVGSDPWIAAQSALAELDTYRADSLALLTDLDQAAITRAATGEQAYPELSAAHDTAQAEFDAESARIRALSGRLPQS